MNNYPPQAKTFTLRILPESPLQKLRIQAEIAEADYWRKKEDPLSRQYYCGMIAGIRHALLALGVALDDYKPPSDHPGMFDEALKSALQKPSLEEALEFIAVWEHERAISRLLIRESCFGYCLKTVKDQWQMREERERP